MTVLFLTVCDANGSSVYDTAGSITESEAKFAVQQAEDLVKKIFAVIDKS